MAVLPVISDKKAKPRSCSQGFTLFELVVTLSVLAILVVGTIPMAQNAVKRQREVRLRETLRMVRNAIDEFKRDTVGACPQGAIRSGNPAAGSGLGPNAQQLGGGGNIPSDPRSRVVIDDCTIFDNQNIDRYPPSLDVLVNGVQVRPRGLNMTSGSGLRPGETQATEINGDTDEVTKHYLREMPVDPMTGDTKWNIRSSYQEPGSGSWDEINVFDIRSTSDEEGLNGEKYSDW
jgi:general secretion pathway protein G